MMAPLLFLLLLIASSCHMLRGQGKSCRLLSLGSNERDGALGKICYLCCDKYVYFKNEKKLAKCSHVSFLSQCRWRRREK